MMLRSALSFSAVLLSAGVAFAAPAAADPNAGSPIMGFLPLIFIFAIFYFLMIRPQQKKYRAHQETLKTLKKGDKVITAGGIIGTISKVEDDIIFVDIADAVTVQVARQSVTDIIGDKPKPATVATKKSKEDGGAKKQVANDN